MRDLDRSGPLRTSDPVISDQLRPRSRGGRRGAVAPPDGIPGDCLPPNNLTLSPSNGLGARPESRSRIGSCRIGRFEAGLHCQSGSKWTAERLKAGFPAGLLGEPVFLAGTTSGVEATYHFERTPAGVPVPEPVDECVTSEPAEPNAICGSPAGAEGAEYTPPNGVGHLDVIDVRACLGRSCDPYYCTARSVQYSLDPEIRDKPYLLGCGLIPIMENEEQSHGVYVATCGCPWKETCVPSGLEFRIEYLYLDEVDLCHRGEIVREVACDEEIEITIVPPICSRDLPEPWQEDPVRKKIFATSLIGTSACSPRACWFAPLQSLDPRIAPATVMTVSKQREEPARSASGQRGRKRASRKPTCRADVASRPCREPRRPNVGRKRVDLLPAGPKRTSDPVISDQLRPRSSGGSRGIAEPPEWHPSCLEWSLPRAERRRASVPRRIHE